MNGFRRYNEIQKAISAHLKEKGISLKASGVKFHQVASGIYKTTKGQPLKPALSNIDHLVDPYVAEAGLPDKLTAMFPFYEFAEYETMDKTLLPPNLYIQSFTTEEQDIPAEDFNYEDHLKHFTTFCNKNIEIKQDRYSPYIFFTQPIKHPTIPNALLSRLITGTENDCGFNLVDLEDSDWEEPIYLDEFKDEVLPEPEAEPEPTPTPEPEPEKKPEIKDKKVKSKKAKAKKKAAKQLVKIKELEIEYEKEKSKTLERKSELLEKYERYFDKGIITKAEFNKKIMEI